MDDSTAKFGMFFLKAPPNSADLLPNDDLVRQLREQGKGGQSHAAPRSGLLGMIDEVRRMAEPFVPGGQATAISDQDEVHPDVLLLDKSMRVYGPNDPDNPANQQGDTGTSDDNKPAPPVSGGGGQPTQAGSPTPAVLPVQSEPSVGGAGNVPPVPTFATTRPVASDPAPPVPPAATVRSESSIFGGDPTKASPIWQGPPAAPATPASTVAAVAQKKLAWRLLNLRTMAFAVPLVVLLVVIIGASIFTKYDQRQSATSAPALVGNAAKWLGVLDEYIGPTVQRVTVLEREAAQFGEQLAAQQRQIDLLGGKITQVEGYSASAPSPVSADDVLAELRRRRAQKKN